MQSDDACDSACVPSAWNSLEQDAAVLGHARCPESLDQTAFTTSGSINNSVGAGSAGGVSATLSDGQEGSGQLTPQWPMGSVAGCLAKKETLALKSCEGGGHGIWQQDFMESWLGGFDFSGTETAHSSPVGSLTEALGSNTRYQEGNLQRRLFEGECDEEPPLAPRGIPVPVSN